MGKEVSLADFRGRKTGRWGCSPVVLDHDYTVWDAFGMEVTPSAVLVGVEGRGASEVAEGAKAVLELARAG